VPIDSEGNVIFPFYQRELEEMFGTPQECEEVYVKTYDFSEFADAFSHVRDYNGNPWKHRIYMNYVMEPPLRAAFRLLVERGLAGELRTYDGCHNIRRSKGGGIYSVHSWGLAIDLNAGSNGYGQKPTLSDAFVLCFADCGFEWGGLWKPDWQRDGMHFQICWIKDRTGPLAPIPWSP
jgi:hypothetical protein